MSERAPTELGDRAEAEAWLAGSLCLVRLGAPGAEEHARVAPWLLGVLAERGALPPAGVIADLGHILCGGSLRAWPPLPAPGTRLAETVRAYEDHVLGRLDADPRLTAVTDAMASLPLLRRDHGVAVLAARVLQRIDFSAGVALVPGVVRRLLRLPVDDLAARGHAALATPGPVLDLLVAGYQGLTAGARRLGALLSEAEVFLIENLDALGELAQRMAIEQIMDVAGALAAALPQRLKPGAPRQRGHIPTPLAAEDHYPTGGFAALATSGSLENLVASELMYMEDERHSAGLDLFDVRYAEGELLYYTRDESVFVRGHRSITFALCADLERLRVKDLGLPWQRLVTALGLITFCVRRLARWLAGEGLRFRIAMIADPARPGAEPLAAEAALAALALRELVAREVASVDACPDLDGVLADASARARGARSDVIVVTAERLAVTAPPGVLLGALHLGEAAPTLTWEPPAAPAAQRDSDAADPWRAWTEVALELLQTLLS